MRISIHAVTVLAAALLVLSSCRSSAHEVPSELTVETFVRPVQGKLQLLVRVPLSGLLGTGMPKEGIGFLSLASIGPSLQQTVRQIAEALDVYEGNNLLVDPKIVTTRISLPFDTSFSSFDQAMAHVTGPPLPVDTQVYWLQGYVDALLEYPIRSDRASFSVRTRLTTLAPRVTTSLRFLPPGDGPVRSFEFVGDAGRVWLEPRWYQAARVFLKFGFLHALGLPDQWLFLFCILVPWRRPRALLRVVASFAAGYTLTGLVVAYGPDATGPWLPALAETVIAALLVYLALENIVAPREDRRWVTTLIFGVLSGIGFSIAVRQVAQFSGGHLLTSVLSFDTGVGLAQLAALAVLIPALALLYSRFSAERLRRIILSALLANVAWATLARRAEELPNLQWPLFTSNTLVTATSWLVVLVVAAGGVWLIAGLLGRPADGTQQTEARKA